MSYKVEVLADSLSPAGVRLTTLLCVYPRFIHSEMLRHRVFSHSVASSRAIPTEHLIEQVANDPFVPATFNQRVKGMGVGDPMKEGDAQKARAAWRSAAQDAAYHATSLMEIGLDKSRANRLLEPFLWVTDIITATEWSNFFALRDHPAAQPEFQVLARMMREAMIESEPDHLGYDHWHVPLVSLDEVMSGTADGEEPIAWDTWKMVSAGRCARVSFDKHGESESVPSSVARAEKLMASGHMSPFEHVARPMRKDDVVSDHDHPYIMVPQTEAGHVGVSIEHSGSDVDLDQMWSGNFKGWVQMRQEIPDQDDFGKILACQNVKV